MRRFQLELVFAAAHPHKLNTTAQIISSDSSESFWTLRRSR